MRILVSLIVLTVILPTKVYTQKYEADYVKLIQKELGGQREYPVPSGYVDLLTSQYAIEVDFANKWKESIGQALWYGLQTNKRPGIVLIKKSDAQYKYVIQLGSALKYSGLEHKIKVWVWPDDFNTHSSQAYSTALSLSFQKYWLTTSSNKRHNSSCRYFENTKGKACNKNQGTSCTKCGG